jgi:hypothetical protein
MNVELREDLADLSEALAALDAACLVGDGVAIVQCQRDVLGLIEALAVLHCGMVGKVLDNQKRLNRQMGMREVLIPRSFEGSWHVFREQS